MKLFINMALMATFGMLLIGCSNTAEGMKEDTNNAAESAKPKMDDTKDAMKDAAKNTVAATEVTPMVKSAITSNSTLNDSRNLIDVDSADGTVHLKGHVATAEMKELASQVAQKVLDDNKSTDKLSNELTVTAPQ